MTRFFHATIAHADRRCEHKPRASATHRDRGFSLVELIFVLLVTSLVTVFALPGYSAFSGKLQLSAEARALVADIHLARNTAITQNQRVVMCKRAASACTSTGGWEQGWLIFMDKGTLNALDSSDTIIRMTDPVQRGTTIRGDANLKNRLGFQGDGSVAGYNGKLVFCDGRISDYSSDKARAILVVIASGGRIRTISGDKDSSVNGCDPAA